MSTPVCICSSSCFPLLFILAHLSRPSLVPLSLPSFHLLAHLLSVMLFPCVLLISPLCLSSPSVSHPSLLTPSLLSFSHLLLCFMFFLLPSPFLFSSFSSPPFLLSPALLFHCHPNFFPPPCCLFPFFLASWFPFILCSFDFLLPTSFLVSMSSCLFHFLLLFPAFLPSFFYVFHLFSYSLDFHHHLIQYWSHIMINITVVFINLTFLSFIV